MSNKNFGLETVISAFLFGVIVGIVGVALFPTRRNADTGVAATATAPQVDTSARGPEPVGMQPAAQTSGGTGAIQGSPQTSRGTGVFINQREITQQQLAAIKQMYGQATPPGRYWYDPRSGLYGKWGFEAAGYIRPGHDFGPLPANASNGNTGVIINGREINMTEAVFFQRIFGAVYKGRWWLDGQTGNVGQEGNPTPVANVVAALQAQGGGRGQGGEGYRWRDNINNSSGGAENGCVWVNMPGASYSSSGC
jgi:hypothetical protein